MDKEKLTVKPSPCASCPYRVGVPSGVWAREEYEMLRTYDGTILEQACNGATEVLGCHQADGQLCSGWVGYRDLHDLLAARLHAAELDDSVPGYQSPVPLFRSGAEAADHGEQDIENPSEAARDTIGKITAVREIRGEPVRRSL